MANDRPYLLDVTRLIWRRWAGRLPTGIDRVSVSLVESGLEHAARTLGPLEGTRVLVEVPGQGYVEVVLTVDSGIR